MYVYICTKRKYDNMAFFDQGAKEKGVPPHSLVTDLAIFSSKHPGFDRNVF